MRRRAGSAVAIAALWMGTVSGCTQLLGIADISAVDGAANVMSGPDASDDGSPVVDVQPAGPDGGSPADGADATVCGTDLSNAGTTGFYISFAMQTTQTDGVIALLNQRDQAQCNLGNFWDLQLVNHKLYFEISDSSGDAIISGQTAPLNDNVLYDIVVSREATGLVKLMINNVLAGSAVLHHALGLLPTLRIGTTVCAGEVPSVDFQGTKGTISNVCLGLQ
ncbi:MAG TPA: LamG domain-containing protein [Polyangia bacterium]|jgi:hypothetical protein|nr:LamG domain-containing protein [Polyangia bacterium]